MLSHGRNCVPSGHFLPPFCSDSITGRDLSILPLSPQAAVQLDHSLHSPITQSTGHGISHSRDRSVASWFEQRLLSSTIPLSSSHFTDLYCIPGKRIIQMNTMSVKVPALAGFRWKLLPNIQRLFSFHQDMRVEKKPSLFNSHQLSYNSCSRLIKLTGRFLFIMKNTNDHQHIPLPH